MTRIDALLTTMGRSYHWYYTHDYNMDIERKANEEFDKRMKTEKDFNNFVSKFITVRGDPITSDREVLAFMKSFKKLGGEKVFYSIPKDEYLRTIEDLAGTNSVWYGNDYGSLAIKAINENFTW